MIQFEIEYYDNKNNVSVFEHLGLLNFLIYLEITFSPC